MLTMNRVSAFSLLSVLVVFLAGCSTTAITNLTPSRLPRKENGLYDFSVEYYTRQSTLMRDTMQAYVIVGAERIPMEPTPMLTNRWETLVPISVDQDLVNYRFRFEYQYKAIPEPRSNSRDSRSYQLQIVDR